MSSDSTPAPSGKRTKATEITDLPDTSVSDEQGDGVKGGGTIVPCVRNIVPCIRPGIPCIRNLPGPSRGS